MLPYSKESMLLQIYLVMKMNLNQLSSAACPVTVRRNAPVWTGKAVYAPIVKHALLGSLLSLTAMKVNVQINL